MSSLRLADVTALLDGWYDPAWAADWDAVGLVCGDPDAAGATGCCSPSTRRRRSSTRRPSGAPTCSSATTRCCSRPVHGVAATTPKGRVVHGLVRAGDRAVHRAHQRRRRRPTASTSRWPGRVGLVDPPVAGRPTADAGARQARRLRPARRTPTRYARRSPRPVPGAIGDYDQCVLHLAGRGQFRPLDGARPAVGEVGELEVVAESRIEIGAARDRLRRPVVEALLAAHPYEEPAYDVLELADRRHRARPRHGRIGGLAAPMTLRELRGAGRPRRCRATAHGRPRRR